MYRGELGACLFQGQVGSRRAFPVDSQLAGQIIRDYHDAGGDDLGQHGIHMKNRSEEIEKKNVEHASDGRDQINQKGFLEKVPHGAVALVNDAGIFKGQLPAENHIDESGKNVCRGEAEILIPPERIDKKPEQNPFHGGGRSSHHRVTQELLSVF